MTNPVFVVTHASFDESRRRGFQRLMSELRMEAPWIPVFVQEDMHRNGSLWCWRKGHEHALSMYPEASHLVWLPDDAIVCKDFGTILRACIRARPDDVFDCSINHRFFRDQTVETCWYSTSDGYTGMGGVMPRALLEEHLRWRDQRPELDAVKYANDAGVNLWAADTGRLIYKPAWSLVQHDTTISSLDGHDEQEAEGHERVGLRPIEKARDGVRFDVMNFLGRTFSAPEEHMPGLARSCTYLGRTYQNNVFDLVRRLKPEHWNVDEMYQAYEPTPLDGVQRVVIVVPMYRETVDIVHATQKSREAVQDDLESHGVECVLLTPPGDSHVDRMRQRATHHALKHGATHILWWDADIECLDPKTVRRMLLSGHDIVAGACPFKNDKRKVVCNLWPNDIERLSRGEEIQTLPGGFIEVKHAGSGFMLMSRRAIIQLMEAHKHLCHLSRSPGDFMEPLWAIWDAQVAGSDLWDRMFLTEDWNICRLWQELGGKVYVHAPSSFRHWGLHGYEASFAESFGLES